MSHGIYKTTVEHGRPGLFDLISDSLLTAALAPTAPPEGSSTIRVAGGAALTDDRPREPSPAVIRAQDVASGASRPRLSRSYNGVRLAESGLQVWYLLWRSASNCLWFWTRAASGAPALPAEPSPAALLGEDELDFLRRPCRLAYFHGSLHHLSCWNACPLLPPTRVPLSSVGGAFRVPRGHT